MARGAGPRPRRLADGQLGVGGEGVARHFEVLRRGAFANAAGGVVNRTMAGAEPAAEFTLRIGRLAAERNAAQVGADAADDEELGLLDPIFVLLGIAQLAHVRLARFVEQFLGRFDPKTGKYSEFPIPVIKPGYPVGTLDLQLDKAGDVWIGMMYQAGIARFDKKTETFKVWSMPKEWQTDAAQTGHLEPTSTHVDGKVWVKNSDGSQIMRFDIKTEQWENLGAFSNPADGKRFGVYGIRADDQNNLYLLDFQTSNIGLIDAKTRQFTVARGNFPNSRPRRGAVDPQNRLWYAEYAGNAIGMYDPKTNQVKEWVLPTAWGQPYDAVADKNGEAWTGSMMSDRVSRLNPKTGDYVEYLLPKTTNIRRVFVDNTTTPVTFWTGSNHGASIVKVEPLD